ncbi:hypothetical protein BH10BAC2_BH10BAC2_17000 [soil metagenome]
MPNSKPLSTNMRIWHRYLGYFLAGIMTIYALSGIIMIFRDTDFLKQEKPVVKQVKPNAAPDELGFMLGIRPFKIQKQDGNIIYFEQGTYNNSTGKAEYTSKEWPAAIEKLTELHKARSGEPLFFLNVFFGISLFFFVISSFWMFLPKTTIFKKGLYFTLAGVILALVLIFLK